MKTLETLTMKGTTRTSRIVTQENEYWVFNLINWDQVSFTQPLKFFKTLNWAKRYANKFLQA